MATNCIVDPNGRPVSSNTLYKTPSSYANGNRLKASPRAKTYEAVSAYQRREMVDISRVIAAGVPNIDTALLQAGEFSVGDSWHIKSRSVDKKWGKKRDEWLNTVFARSCNLRGDMNDWRSSLRQLNWTRKVEGDYAIVFDGAPSKDPISGREKDPSGKFFVIKYDRINNGLHGAVSVGNGLEKVKEVGRDSYSSFQSTGWGSFSGMYIIDDASSPFDGQRIIDGVILSANMEVLGYRVTGFKEDGTPTYCDLPKAQLHFNFSARKQVDLIRGIPELAEAIIPQMNLDDIQYLIGMAIKLASAMAVTRESADGNPNRANRAAHDEEETDSDGETTTVRRTVEEIFPGIIELATNNREALKALDFNRPSMQEETFIERVETSLLHKLWPRSLIYCESTGRAGTRAVAIQANTICTWDQCCLERDARFVANQASVFAMRAGFIPTNNNPADPFEYGFTVPGKFTVDEGNDMKMRLLALGRCCISRGQIVELEGYMAEEIEEQREAEIDRTIEAAKRLHAKHGEFDLKELVLMMDNSDSNISFTDSSAVEVGGESGQVRKRESGKEKGK